MTTPSFPPPTSDPVPAPPAYPPPQGDPAYAVVHGSAYPPLGEPASGLPANQPPPGWQPAPLGGNPANWAPPGWPQPVPAAVQPYPQPYLPEPAHQQLAYSPVGYQPSAYPPVGYPQPGYLPGPVPPAPAPRRPVWLTVAVVIIVLALVGTGALLVLQAVKPPPSPVGQQTTEVAGGDIGKAVELTGPNGSARVTATGARWTSEGTVAPVPGTGYLVVDVSLEGVDGEFTTGGVFTVVIAAGGQRYGVSYGPVLDPLLTSRALGPGETNTGQLGYQLAPGPVQLEFQTPDGVRLGSLEIPGP